MRSMRIFFCLLSAAIASAFCGACCAVCDDGGIKPVADEIRGVINSKQTIPEGAKIVCTDDAGGRIMIMDANKDWNSPEAVVWEFKFADAPEIDAATKKRCFNPSDAKPVLGTTHIMANCSPGGVALIRVADKKTVFYSQAKMYPHSMAMFPDGNIAVASSKDSLITVYAVGEKTNTTATSKYSTIHYDDAHGVVWDKKRKVLWAVGKKDISKFSYNFDKENPRISLVETYPFPEPYYGGHDIFPVPNRDMLFFTAVNVVGLFSPRDGSYEAVSDIKNVKSISQHPSNGALIIQKPDEKWYSNRVRFLDKNLTDVAVKNNCKFYKARWFVPNYFSE